MKRKDSILQQYYMSKLPKAQEAGAISILPRSTGDLRGPKIDPKMGVNIAAAEKKNRQAQMKALQPKPSFIGPSTDVRTVKEKQAQRAEIEREKALQNSALAQTIGMGLPGKYTPEVSGIGAKSFQSLVNAFPQSTSNLVQLVTGKQPYGDDRLQSVLGATGDVFTVAGGLASVLPSRVLSAAAKAKRLQATPGQAPLSIIPKGNYLQDDLLKANQITLGEVEDIAKKEMDWIQSAEYARRRAAATGENPTQIKKDVSNILGEWKKTQLSVEDLGKKTKGQYIPGKAPGVYINPIMGRQQGLGILSHEIKHAFSPLATTRKGFKNYPTVNVGNIGEKIRHPFDVAYIASKPEQNVRSLRLLDFIEKTQGVERGTPLELKNMQQLADDINKGGRFRDVFKTEYPDVDEYVQGLASGSDIFKFVPKNILKGKKPYEWARNPRLREILLDQLNKAYVVPGAVGVGATMMSNKKKGGIIDDQRGQWAHPGQITRIKGNQMATHGYGNIPLHVKASTGEERIVYPNTGTQTFDGATSFVETPLSEYYKMKTGGGYKVTRSNDRKGKTHKVTGPDGTVKYFGDSKLGQHPNDPERKKAFYARHKKNLDKNPYFRAFARATWQDGGDIESIDNMEDSLMEYYQMKKGGLTPNKAREILHDKEVHGKPLTEKQRRFFGAMSKGHTKKYQFAGQTSTTDSVRHQANKILQYEQLRGGPGGTPLPGYSDPKYMNMLMGNIYPEVKKILPNASAIEAGEAMDFIFNAGWDKTNNKITKDPRAFALQEYYRQYDPSKLDQDGKWAGRKNAPYSFDQEYASTIGKLPENERRVLMNKGRDWYYKNINNPSPGVPNSNYYDTWYGRIWNTNDYQPFNPNNPKFVPKKQTGGELGIFPSTGMQVNIKQGARFPREQFGGDDISIPNLRNPLFPKFQLAGQTSKPKRKNIILVESPELISKTPSKEPNPFMQEAKEMQAFINKNFPGEEVSIIPTYGTNPRQSFQQAVAKSDPNTRLTMMAHSGDMLFGIPAEEVANTLKKTKYENCYLGTCYGEQFMDYPEFQNLEKFYYRPLHKWLGFNPGKNPYKGEEAIKYGMFSTMPTEKSEKLFRDVENVWATFWGKYKDEDLSDEQMAKKYPSFKKDLADAKAKSERLRTEAKKAGDYITPTLKKGYNWDIGNKPYPMRAPENPYRQPMPYFTRDLLYNSWDESEY